MIPFLDLKAQYAAIGGDVANDDMTVPGGLDIVIHCAASVSFEQPIDEALELNGKGPARLLKAVRDAGSDPYLVHVSTAYAAGQRTGLVLERPSGTSPSEPWLDIDGELDAGRTWRRDIEAESRLPLHQKRFVKEAEDVATTSAQRRQDISAGLQRLPTFLREMRPTMAELGATADASTPYLRDLNASAGQLTRFLTDLGPFAASSRGRNQSTRSSASIRNAFMS